MMDTILATAAVTNALGALPTSKFRWLQRTRSTEVSVLQQWFMFIYTAPPAHAEQRVDGEWRDVPVEKE